MNGLSKISIALFALLLIANLIEQIFRDNKVSKYIQPAVYSMIIAAVFLLFSEIKLPQKYSLSSQNYTANVNEVWDSTGDWLEIELSKNMTELCEKESLEIESITLDITSENETFKINEIVISGRDSIPASNLISSYYGIEKNIIFTEEV